MGAAKVYIETYGCQMNEYDSEIVRGILTARGHALTDNLDEADTIFLNTCSVRENAHQKVLKRIEMLRASRNDNGGLTIGVLGCMAQALKKELLEEGIGVDIVAGPDSYRRLPELLAEVRELGQPGAELKPDKFETYSDLFPTTQSGKVNAWISVMRGCDNYCTFCVVPYTRGRERCREPENVLEEGRALAAAGYKQLTLLGQNVNSYRHGPCDFAALIMRLSQIEGIARIRFTSPHPKDFPERLIQVVAKNPKACKHIHLPAQSGNSRVLKMMNRTYDREEFLALAHKMRAEIPGLALSTDVIVGFPTETREEFEDTLSLMREVEFDSAFMFKYSERPGTTAAKKYLDDVPESEKTERITRLVDMQREISLKRNQAHLGQTFEVLVEGPAKKEGQLMGRTDGNKIAVFPDKGQLPGEFVSVTISEVTPNTLISS